MKMIVTKISEYRECWKAMIVTKVKDRRGGKSR